MTTDFSYDGKQIVSGGPFKPGGKDMPNDARTRVESYADIASIPNPYVGLKITVKVDETNNNKMTDYIVKSLKANSSGIANMAINEVVRYVDYLGVASGGTGEVPSTNLNDYQKKADNTLATTDKTVVGAINELKNGINNIDVPVKVSELTNDLMYVTNSQLNELLKDSGITPPETDTTLRWVVAPETLELTPGIDKEITVTLNDTITGGSFKFGSNASILTFSGTDLFNNQNILMFNNKDKTSNNITITANATDRKLVDYLYFGKYNDNNNGYNIIPSKTKVIINPSSETINVDSISLSQNSLSINKGETVTLNANISPAGATNKNVTWSTNNSNVSLTPNVLSCEILGNIAGSSVVTVTSEDGNKTASCNISITDVDTPSEPTGNIITDGLQVYIDGRDVERGSTQAYWSNKVEGSSLSQIPIAGQFKTPSSEWNDATKTYGWLGDSFRYYLENKIQPTNTIPNFSESTTEFTVEIGFLKEQQTLVDSQNTAFTIFNAGNAGVSNITLQPKADGTVRTYCSVNGVSNYTDTSTDTAVKHYAITANGDNTVSVYDGTTLIATLSAVRDYPFVYPFDSFTLAKGTYTQNVRIYYLRIYNRKLTAEEIRSNYQYESSIERSVN